MAMVVTMTTRAIAALRSGPLSAFWVLAANYGNSRRRPYLLRIDRKAGWFPRFRRRRYRRAMKSRTWRASRHSLKKIFARIEYSLTVADAGRGPSREIFCKPRKGRCGRPAGAGRESARSLVSEIPIGQSVSLPIAQSTARPLTIVALRYVARSRTRVARHRRCRRIGTCGSNLEE